MIIEAENIVLNYFVPVDEAKSTSKKRRVDAFSQVTSSTSLNKIETFFSSIQLIKTTKKHNIYKVSTPDGIRALKTTVTDNPTIEEVQNLDNELKMGIRTSFYVYL